MNWIIRPAAAPQGELTVPGDKSISHRLALLALLANGETRIRGFLRSEDCLCTLEAVRQLGARVDFDGDVLSIGGCGGMLQAPRREIDCGNSGTGMRLLAGLMAGLPVSGVLSGDVSLCSRPMDRILVPLKQMGAKVVSRDGSGCAPLQITGGRLKAVHYAMPVASAQVKSCILLAGLSAEGETTVVEPAPSRDHTERLLRVMGAPVAVEGMTVRLRGSNGETLKLKPGEFVVPGDLSSAAFWLTAAAAMPEGDVTVRDVGVNPRRSALLDVLRMMGADVVVKARTASKAADPSGRSHETWEPRADITVHGGRLKAFDLGGERIPNLIDEVPILCFAAALAEGVSVIRDAAELRVKESDRIEAMAEVLSGFGVAVEPRQDGLRIQGTRRLRGGGRIDCRGDHRIAMSACLLALAADSPTEIRGVDCVATSYPGFHGDLKGLTASSDRSRNSKTAAWR